MAMTRPTVPGSSAPSPSSVLDAFRLDDRVAVIADGATPTGLAFATALAQAGADVVLTGPHMAELDSAVASVRSTGRSALAITHDITDPEGAADFTRAVLAKFGRIDILVNNAEVHSATAAIGESSDHFRSIVDVNLNGTYWLARAAARVMAPGSSIVNMSSIFALTTTDTPLAAYSATKSAVSGLTRDLAQQWGTRKGIRVNAIAPGFFDDGVDHGPSPTFGRGINHRLVLGRTGRLEELAAALVWLASDASAYVTGQTIVVDGGVSIT